MGMTIVTYWDIDTVHVACVKVGASISATLKVLRAEPTLLWAGVRAPPKDPEWSCRPRCREGDHVRVTEGWDTLSRCLASGVHVIEGKWMSYSLVPRLSPVLI